MDRELTPEEIADLLPAYALDAVDDDERAAIDEYLARTPEARDDGRRVPGCGVDARAHGWPAARRRVGAARVDHRRVAAARCGRCRRPTVIDAPPPCPTARPGRVPVAVGRGRRRGRWRWCSRACGSSTARCDRSVTPGHRGAGTRRARRAGRASRGAHRFRRSRRSRPPWCSATAPATSRRSCRALRRIRRTSSGASPGRARSRSACSVANPNVVAFKAAAPTQSLAITTEAAGGVPVSHNAPDAVGDVVPPDIAITSFARVFHPRAPCAPNTCATHHRPPDSRGETAWQSTKRGCATCSTSRRTCTPTRWRVTRSRSTSSSSSRTTSRRHR